MRLALLVRCLAGLIIIAAAVILFWGGRALADWPTAIVMLGFLGWPLLFPLLLASDAKPFLTKALLIGFVPAAIGVLYVIWSVDPAASSTAVLGYLAIPFFLAIAFVPAAVFGWVLERANRPPKDDWRP